MSTVRPTTLEPPEIPANDPFYLGTRLVVQGDSYELIPLTLDDVLHPQLEDRVTLSDEHRLLCVYLTQAIETLVKSIPHAEVVSDLLVIWDDPELRPHGPDVALIFNVRERRKWTSFDVAEEGTRPTLIIEVTSPSTRYLDVGVKVEQYAQAGVEYYVIVDLVPQRGVSTPRLFGYQLGTAGYEEMPLNGRGDLWVEPARCWLRVVKGEVLCEDEYGTIISDYQEVIEERDSALQRADSETERADSETERANAAEERVAVESKARAIAEERVVAEAEARARAEAKIRELEAKLRQHEEPK